MAKALAGDESDDIILERGDVISIPTSNYTIDIKGAVQIPGLVQYLPGKKARYYADVVGAYSRTADVRRVRIERANGLVMKANRRFWFDRTVPPGATIVVPEKGPVESLWRQQRIVGFAVGAVLTSVGWYAAK